MLLVTRATNKRRRLVVSANAVQTTRDVVSDAASIMANALTLICAKSPQTARLHYCNVVNANMLYVWLNHRRHKKNV